jgi:hypothetical protein
MQRFWWSSQIITCVCTPPRTLSLFIAKTAAHTEDATILQRLHITFAEITWN